MKEINSHNTNKIAELFSRSFYLDPLFKHFFPDDNTRGRLSFFTFRFIVAHAFKNGSIESVSSSLEGAAVWLPSSSINRGLIDQIRFGAINMYMKQGGDTINRQVKASEYMKSLHSSLLPSPHLYLSTIGIDEAHQKKGLASHLIQPMLDQADRAQLPCYLDTHNENNVALYQRFGFRVACQSTIPNSNVQHWPMIRDHQ